MSPTHVTPLNDLIQGWDSILYQPRSKTSCLVVRSTPHGLSKSAIVVCTSAYVCNLVEEDKNPEMRNKGNGPQRQCGHWT